MKIIVGPGVVGCEDGFGVVSTHFRNPFHAQFFGNCTSEGGGSGGFGATTTMRAASPARTGSERYCQFPKRSARILVPDMG